MARPLIVLAPWNVYQLSLIILLRGTYSGIESSITSDSLYAACDIEQRRVSENLAAPARPGGESAADVDFTERSCSSAIPVSGSRSLLAGPHVLNHLQLSTGVGAGLAGLAYCMPARGGFNPASAASVYDLSLADVAVGVLASTERAERASVLEKTWLKAFPNRLMTADADAIQGVSPSTLIVNIQTSNISDGWAKAQVRFIPRLDAMFELWPEASWHLLVDDDTFVEPGRLLEELSKFPNPQEEPYYVGHWTRSKDGKPYLFGGAGVAISQAALMALSPHLGPGKSCDKLNAKRLSSMTTHAHTNNTDAEGADLWLGDCLAELASVKPICHPGFSQYGYAKPQKLPPPWVSVHRIEPPSMLAWSANQEK
mmetsp:Transcript_4039/g.7156  ORF Transcript_4039/g.7156 Transcript_4039/m.7156 type:complete len:370 (-) Transcript_4039:160-1269(-)